VPEYNRDLDATRREAEEKRQAAAQAERSKVEADARDAADAIRGLGDVFKKAIQNAVNDVIKNMKNEGYMKNASPNQPGST
jgi:Skp family chaperone for outer membrane proteins